MPLATRHRNDFAPPLAALPALVVRRETSVAAMAALQGKPEDEVCRRFAEGHRAYVASLDARPVAWGWVATRTAAIGELGSAFRIPDGERYLWNFVTLAAHRGQGIYPRLVDAIVRAESQEAERFWIARAPENHASGAGIRRAGFATVAELSFDAAGRPAVRGIVEGGGALAARLLGIAEAADSLARCWRCVRAGRGAMSCAADACRCDYQHPESGCAA
jgi:ribosomal protein S18 acetylase RimI-like enzyme